jgi:predicted DNA-binding protein
MEIHFTPEIEKRLADLAAQTGRGAEELVQQVIAGYVNELSTVRGLLDSRYDELKSGAVRPIDGEEVFTDLREKSQRRRRSSS